MGNKKEYPRPQFIRKDWRSLNGTWQFAFDDHNRGLEEKWYEEDWELPDNIEVPFVYQSELSGIGDKTSHDIVWYKREISLDKAGCQECVLLHFEAVDFQAQVFLNGQMIGEHSGGYTPFTFDITPYLKEGKQILALRVWDPSYDEEVPRGKQFWEDESAGIWYTRSSGIWQTVWLETVAEKRIGNVKFTPIFDEGRVRIQCDGIKTDKDDTLEYQISFQGSAIAEGTMRFIAESLTWDVDLIQNKIFRTNFHNDGYCWTPETPNLFDVTLKLTTGNGKCTDEVQSYFGFRKIHTENGKIYLNNKPYYQKLVLDQGYWPGGIMTAPDDDALKYDIEIAKEMGFNGCRKHQKMEEQRFLYWADKLGFLVWGECASAPVFSKKSVDYLMTGWREIIDRDYNHPCVIVWVPLNESWGVPMIHNNEMEQHFSQALYHYLHAVDHTRLVVSNDGWDTTVTDICAIHNYAHGQKDEVIKYQAYKEALSTRETLLSQPSTGWDIYARGFANRGEPIMLTEFGGIGYDVSGEKGWGYTSVDSEDTFIEDYDRIMNAVRASRGLCGYCYTQLADVEQEINGLLTYDRKPKCDVQKLFEINNR